MGERVRWQLSGMMALMYAVQGSWWPLFAVHLQDLGISGRALGWIFATYAIGCCAAPLCAGQVADRIVPTQKLLSIIYGLGTGFLVLLAAGTTLQSERLFVLLFVYWLMTAPAYALANSLAFRNLARPREQFGAIRLCGTIGWMSVGWLVSALLAWNGSSRIGQGTYEAFWVATALSALLAVYCYRLPSTPPLATGKLGGLALREGLDLVRRPPVAVFLVTAFGVSLSTPFVYQTVPAYLQTLGMPRTWIATAMSLGQVPEIISLAALPWLMKRFGLRTTMAIGIGAWIAYYLILCARPPLAVALVALPLNGVAIACFMVAGQIFLDGQAPAHRRASVQALHVVVTSGIGCLVGNVLAGELVSRAGGISATIFLVPCLLNGVLLVAFLLGFQRGARTKEAIPAAPQPVRFPGTSGALTGAVRLAPNSGQQEAP
jgi:MFS family permease